MNLQGSARKWKLKSSGSLCSGDVDLYHDQWGWQVQTFAIAKDFLEGQCVLFIVKWKARRVKIKPEGEKKDFSMLEIGAR